MTAELQAIARASGCEIRDDTLTRQLYATDASIYQIEPLGVAFPRNASEAAAVIRLAVEADIPIIPRGAGTGLAGGAIGRGLVVDFYRHNRQITNLNVEARTVRVGPGVVLDVLNATLRPYGLQFGPDVATSSRASLGGMIANNSSGAHTPVYGITGDHVRSLDVVLPDGRLITLTRSGANPAPLAGDVAGILETYAPAIRERMPPGLPKRYPGYGFDRALARPGDLTQILAGSEGTLGAIVSAELDLVPLPARRALGVLFFASVADAMQASVELRDLRPAAIEHIDRLLFDQTAGQLQFKRARDLFLLDESPCESILLVEFFAGPSEDRQLEDQLAALAARRIGLRQLILTGEQEQQLVWGIRKAGLTLLTSRKGPAKPIAGIEDVVVRPEHLPAFVAALQGLLAPLGVEASYYGHAAAGLLHVRPVIDLHRADDIAKFRHIADEVAALTKQFRGSIAGEHGVGIARTEYLADQLGPELMAASRALKKIFDPRGLMNPGKIIPGDPPYRIDTNLRYGAGHRIETPFQPVLGFVERDESFVGNLEQCNGNGACLKNVATMCPTYLVTHEEIMATRGRANTIRAALEGRLSRVPLDALDSPELDAALSPCLSCKACKNECPSNVDLAQLKAELLHARVRRDGPSLADRAIAASDLLGRIGSAAAPLVNATLSTGWVRGLMERLLGIDRRRSLPTYAEERFDHWFARRPRASSAPRGRVVLWDDTWVRYHEPDIGRAAVTVLEAAGFEVVLPERRECCGRPAFSRGLLDEAAAAARHNLALLGEAYAGLPVVFLEPSCHSMFVDDYRQLRVTGAAEVAARCWQFEEFIENLLANEPDALPLAGGDGVNIAIHAHCHAKALRDVTIHKRLAARIPGADVTLLNTACCGMAGAYGMQRKTYELSMQLGEALAARLAEQPEGTLVVASGTSCRHQITDVTPHRPLHMAEVLAKHLNLPAPDHV